MSGLMTVDQLQKVMPKDLKMKATQSLVDKINGMTSDPILRETLRDNILGYTHVMKEGKFKMESYLNAVRYVSFKLMGNSNIEAYTKTFPDKYNYWVKNGTSEKDISAYVAIYNKSKLVNLIYEQTIVPSHVLNQDLHQKALNVQAELMVSAKSEKVRSDAANSLLTHLKAPEVKKVELDVGIKEDKSINELREATLALAAQQRKLLESGGANAQEIAHSKIITGESETIKVE